MARKTRLARAKALADKHCSAYFQGKPCAVCGTTIGTVGHHIVTRSVGFLRHYELNILPLCQEHHTGCDKAPHSMSKNARERFQTFLETDCQERMDYLAEHRHDRTIPTAEDYEAKAAFWKEMGEADGN